MSSNMINSSSQGHQKCHQKGHQEGHQMTASPPSIVTMTSHLSAKDMVIQKGISDHDKVASMGSERHQEGIKGY
jgi:hypothetical protein